MSSGDIGTKIYLDGEKQYKQAIADINRNMKVLGSEMGIVTAQFDKNDKSEQALAARSEVLTKQIEAQKDKINELQKALDNAKEGFGENDKRTQNWQIALNKAQAELVGMEKELKDTSGDLKDVDKNTEKAGNGMEKLGEISKKAAKAIGGAFAAIGAGVIAGGKALVDMAKSAADTGDEIEKTSQKVGLSYESYQKWDYAMKIAGTSMTDCTNGLKTLTNTFDDAINGSASAQTKFERLGLSLDDLKGKSREEVFEATISALQNVSDETEKAALANDMFGKSGQNLLPMLNQSSEETQKLLAEAEEYGMVMGDDAVKASAAFQDSLSRLEGTIGGVKNKIGGELLPGLTQITDGLAGLLVGNEDATKSISEGVENVVTAIGSMVPQITQLLSTVAEGLVGALPQVFEAVGMEVFSAVSDLLPVVIDAAGKLVESLAIMLPDILWTLLQSVLSVATDLLSELLPNILPALAEMIGIIGNELGILLRQFLPVLIQAVLDAAVALVDQAPVLIEAVISLAQGALAAIIKSIPVLVSSIPMILDAVISALTSGIPLLLEGAISLFNALIDAIPIIIESLIQNLPLIIESLVSGLTTAIPMLLRASIQLFMALVDAIPTVTVTLLREAPKLIGTILSSLANALPDMLKMGGELLEGLWDGIKNMQNWLVEKLKGLGHLITDALKAVFGIHSPSKVFADQIGKNLGLGIGVGFEESMKTVSKDMADAIPTDFDIAANVESSVTPSIYGAAQMADYSGLTGSGTSSVVSEIRSLRNELASMRDGLKRNGLGVDVMNWRQGRRALQT